jgi:hypothetical protein
MIRKSSPRAALPQPLRVERHCTDQQFIQQDAEKIDV